MAGTAVIRSFALLSPSMSLWAVAFDFAEKSYRQVGAAEIPGAIDSGQYVWLDVDPDTLKDLDSVVHRLGIPEEVLEDARSDEAGTQHARYSTCLHMVLSGCYLGEDYFELQRVDAIVGEQFLVTIHRDVVEFIEKTKMDFPDDFVHHAETPSFLIYELWDHLLDRYVLVQNQFEARVEHLQSRLIDVVDESLFKEIAGVGAVLVHFRKVLLPARAVLSDLATRKTRFVSEATQPFLANMTGTVERVLQDLLADREILSDSLNLHVSAVSHRTNEVMKRLTGVSVIFLPLTFLVGVYGMNFDVQPELHWRLGYALFWIVAVGMAGFLLFLLWRKRLL